MKNYSIIQQPLVISKKSVSEYLYSALPEVIYKGGEADGFDFDIVIKKLDVPDLSIDGKRINLRLPLLVHVTKNIGFMSAVAEGEILLEVGSDLDIDEEWNLKTKTELVAYSWSKEPELKLMGMKIPVTNLTNKLIEQNKDMMTRQIDRVISSLTFLKEAVDQLEERLKSPVIIGEEEGVELIISPVSVGLSDFVSDNYLIQTVLQLKANVTVSDEDVDEMNEGINEIENEDINEIENEDINEISKLETHQNLVFEWLSEPLKKQDISLSLDLTTNQIQKVVDRIIEITPKEDRMFEIRNKMTEVTDVKILMKDENIGAKVFLTGGYKGNVDYMATPSWNNGKKKIVLCEPELTTNIKGGRSKLLLFFFKKSIRNKITNEVEAVINDQLNEQLQIMNERMDDFEISPKSKGSGAITNMKIQPIQVEHNLLRIDVHMNMLGEIITNGLKIELVGELDK